MLENYVYYYTNISIKIFTDSGVISTVILRIYTADTSNDVNTFWCYVMECTVTTFGPSKPN